MSPVYQDKCPECGKEFRNYTSIGHRLRCSVACDARAAVAIEAILVPRETLERVRGTLARLAHLEAAGHRAGLMSNDSRAALEDLDRVLNE